MIERQEWNGAFGRRVRVAPVLNLVMPLQPSSQGAARAFLGRASDGKRYWLKVPTSNVGPRMLAAEQIVGRLGALLGASTCLVETVRIPSDLGWEIRPGEVLTEGVAHASRHVPDASETRHLNRPMDDDNAVRYTSFAALYDWAWGNDVQGLEVASNMGQFFSHDHGWFLPPGDGNWRPRVVEDFVDTPHEYREVSVDPAEARRIAARLENLTREDLATVLTYVPAEWGVPDNELESIGYYLERRAPQVAERILRRAGGRT